MYLNTKYIFQIYLNTKYISSTEMYEQAHSFILFFCIRMQQKLLAGKTYSRPNFFAITV